MDVSALKNYILEDHKLIELILEKSGFYNIQYNKYRQEYRCSRESGTNPTSVKVNAKTLNSACFSTGVNGDLITIIQDKLNVTFPKTIEIISNIVDFKEESKINMYVPPFGGYYKNIAKLYDSNDVDLEIYSDNVLDSYEIRPNMLFYEDGISPQVQMNYKIGYDSVTGRITVPWKSFDGNWCGIMGRLNKKHLNEDEIKWYPILPFPKSKTLYGYADNYNSILDKGIVFIGESEKFTHQLASKGLNIGVSLGGSFMSEIQANHIKSLYTKSILIMLDEGLEEEMSIEIAKKLKFNNFFKNKVGYVYDKNNAYLPKDSKLAPSDLDKSTLKQLISNCTIWI